MTSRLAKSSSGLRLMSEQKLQSTSSVQGTLDLQQSASISRPRLYLRSFDESFVHSVLHITALCFVLASAVAARLLLLDAVGYNSDEAVYASQGAAIAQVPILKDFFPIFRAH